MKCDQDTLAAVAFVCLFMISAWSEGRVQFEMLVLVFGKELYHDIVEAKEEILY